MATPSYSARFSSATSRASPASSFVSAKMVAWNPSERSPGERPRSPDVCRTRGCASRSGSKKARSASWKLSHGVPGSTRGVERLDPGREPGERHLLADLPEENADADQ